MSAAKFIILAFKILALSKEITEQKLANMYDSLKQYKISAVSLLTDLLIGLSA